MLILFILELVNIFIIIILYVISYKWFHDAFECTIRLLDLGFSD
jgi:hypothetical protein